MRAWFWTPVVLSLIAIAYKLWFYESVTSKGKHYHIVLGILSSRDHFLQRNVIRKGLAKQVFSNSVAVRFIVASRPCSVPEEYRVNPYTCQFHSLENIPTGILYSQNLTWSPHVVKPLIHDEPIGLDFEVLHDLTVLEVGLYDYNEDGFKSGLQVSLYDVLSQNRILSVIFVPFSGGNLTGNFRYKPVNEVVLPKGFRGCVVVEGSNILDPMFTDGECSHDTGNGVLHFYKGYRYGFERGKFPEHFVSSIKSPCYFHGVSFKYSAASSNRNDSPLFYLDDDDDSMQRYIDAEESQLNQEQTDHNDVVFVPTVETYRNLPQKMLLFYSWLSSNMEFNYFMKSDDDTFINLPGILKYMEKTSIHHRMSNVWMGSFRQYFPLDLHGKWQETDYKSSTYPPFACGSGYILSKNIVVWISKNVDHLKIYQGEDTSLGIWLSSIHVDRIHNSKFQCFHVPRNDVFTSPENNISQLQELYGITTE